MSGQFAFTIRMADGAVRRRVVAAGTFALGREPDCDLVIESADVSRHHARLILHEQDFQVVDLGSTLGTKLNGQPLRGPARATYPAMLQLGSVSIAVKTAAGEADAELTAKDAAPPSADPRARVPYAFGSQIARGGMGSILEAEDRKIGRKVAVKIMLVELDADEAQKQRFINEAAVLGRLEHPNIVPIHDLGLDAQGQLYYTMKLVKGRTLQAILNGLRDGDVERGKHFTLDRLLTIFRKVCDAMAFSHSRNIIHRDLKPENVMVGEFGEVLVMDWGLAKFLGEKDEGGRLKDESIPRGETPLSSFVLPTSSFGMTLEGDVMGTPQYMSPEQAEGRVAEMDARSDVFSLGGILYTILTLRPPVEGKTLDEVLKKVIIGMITPLHLQGVGPAKSHQKNERHLVGAAPRFIPAALAAVTMKALSVARENRYQNVAALSTDIEAYQSGFATSAEHAGAWKQFTLLVKRHKAASIGAAAALIIGGVFGTRAVVEGRRAERALADLRGTAPTFQAQAIALLNDGKFDEAVEKIGFAIKLDDANADYRLFRANLWQAMQRIDEAASAYRQVLELRPGDQSAKTNLALCEQLLAESGGGASLSRGQQKRLLGALRVQKRLVEAGPLNALLEPDMAIAEATLRARLREYQKQPGWRNDRVARLPDGTFKVDLGSLASGDLSLLHGQPISALHLRNTSTADLSPLMGLPLKELNLNASIVADLSPLRGMPLENLDLTGTQVKDLLSLTGMKLRALVLNETSITDLAPLTGMPLESLSLYSMRVVDLAPLRGMPLTSLAVINCGALSDFTPLATCSKLQRIYFTNTSVRDLTPLAKLHLTDLRGNGSRVTDLTPLRGLPLRLISLGNCPSGIDVSPLSDCPTLEEIILPQQAKSVDSLRQLLRLKRISTRGTADIPAQTAAEFWKEFDTQKAAGKK